LKDSALTIIFVHFTRLEVLNGKRVQEWSGRKLRECELFGRGKVFRSHVFLMWLKGEINLDVQPHIRFCRFNMSGAVEFGLSIVGAVAVLDVAIK
jgi:hypothetical protein